MENEYYRSGKYRRFVKETLVPQTTVAVIDTETLGLDKYEEIIQFAALKLTVEEDLSLTETDRINIYIKPQKPVPPKITCITGITNEFLADKNTEDVEFPVIDRFLSDVDVIAGHNVEFDIYKIKGMYFRQGSYFLKEMPVIDTLEMSRDFEPKRSHKLGDMCALYGLDAGLNFHNASDDITATKRLLEYFLKSYDSLKEWTGTVKTDISVINYYEMPNHRENRIYVNTDFGTVYYNVYYKCWGAKNGTDMRQLDMEYIQSEALRLLELKDMDEFGKFRGKFQRKGQEIC